MQDDGWRAVYSSPQERALRTAEPAASMLGLPLLVEDGLREIDHGAWDGLSVEEVRARDRTRFERWEEHAGILAPPGGESGYQVAGRALPVIEQIHREHPDGRVLVVSHKATLRIIACALLGIDLDMYRSRLAAPVGSFTIIEMTPRGPLLRALAEVSHLPPELRMGGGL